MTTQFCYPTLKDWAWLLSSSLIVLSEAKIHYNALQVPAHWATPSGKLNSSKLVSGRWTFFTPFAPFIEIVIQLPVSGSAVVFKSEHQVTTGVSASGKYYCWVLCCPFVKSVWSLSLFFGSTSTAGAQVQPAVMIKEHPFNTRQMPSASF